MNKKPVVELREILRLAKEMPKHFMSEKVLKKDKSPEIVQATDLPVDYNDAFSNVNDSDEHLKRLKEKFGSMQLHIKTTIIKLDLMVKWLG